jgi:hypothetical protein
VRSNGTWGLTGFMVVAIAAGCSGNSTAPTLSAVDLQRITTIQPVMPGWNWPLEPVPQGDAPPSEAPSMSPGAPDPLTAELERQIADAGGIVATEGSRWQDADKVGVTFAWLLQSSNGAHTALAAERAFEHSWAERDGGNLSDHPIERLGDEAWAIVGTDSPVGQTATYAWRRNSLVLMVHVQCIFRACPSDISLAARGWVDAIDRVAATAIANPASGSP